jgi:hypothetical protein
LPILKSTKAAIMLPAAIKKDEVTRNTRTNLRVQQVVTLRTHQRARSAVHAKKLRLPLAPLVTGQQQSQNSGCSGEDEDDDGKGQRDLSANTLRQSRKSRDRKREHLEYEN